MKIIIGILFAAGLFAQQQQQAPAPLPPVVVTPPSSVAVTILITNADASTRTYTVVLSDASVAALAQFVADQGAKYIDIGDLLNQHLSASLFVPLVLKYHADPSIDSAVANAAAAQSALTAAATSAAAGTVTVK